MTDATPWTMDIPPIQGLGLMRLKDDGWGDSDRDPAVLVRTAVEAGVSLLDTAEMYGNEELVGRALGSYREQVTLCSKFGVYWGESGRFDDWSVRADPHTVHTAIDGTLERLGVDNLDVYYLHHRSEKTPIEETVAAMAELKQAGKIGHLGLSNVTVDDIRRAHAIHPITVVQQQWSLAHREAESFLPTLAELDIALIAHSPLGHGSLTGSDDTPLVHTLARIASNRGMTTGQIALAWVHHRGNDAAATVVPLPGTSSISHLRANIDAAQLVLDSSEIEQLDAGSQIVP
ncbi:MULTISPECIES: aldo/keto reductase [unclassified Rhodococcus (in: high G+C Gram-positive bacteria)]|uniref:aldo/keto reductase n=1 Tax=unclassified Rhodococcus (in: high G+C Gram-positive bacteria) TaxID=192944 RepID=UPI000ABAB55A|nr:MULTISPECIES: aldo/keto reductase [unclassified Rhodococcus (in: high G+C Gram-positive bacteria)]